MRTIYLAGGCFWGVQRFFDQFDGVISTEVGYANGPDEPPSYQEVCASSGHAETVKIDYDPAVISLTDLLKDYFMVIDPLSVNRQGNDRGIQYRTGIYYTEESQLPEIEAVYQAQERAAGQKLAVELEKLRNFSLQRNTTKSIWKRIRAVTVIFPGTCLRFSSGERKRRQQRKRKRRNSFGDGSAIGPLKGPGTLRRRKKRIRRFLRKNWKRSMHGRKENDHDQDLRHAHLPLLRLCA